MGLSDRLRDAVLAVMGVSEYERNAPTGYGVDLGSSAVKEVRRAIGGNIQALPTTKLRWYLKDLEDAQAAADAGYLYHAARLHRSMYRDGVLRGLAGSRTSGLIRLPKRFYGNPEVAEALKARNGSRAVFDEMFPPSELALLAWDGIDLGIGVAELVPVQGRSYPVMVRLEPEFLQYRWNENRWYFNSLAGALPITPGDGRWILHIPGGRLTPWTAGLWPSLGRSFINKEHAMNHRSNYSAKLANPARVAVSPIGANEEQRQTFFRRLMAWGVNTVFSLPVGWDVKLIESNGKGYDVFQSEIDTSNEEFMVAVAGQMVTTTGGSGFANAEVPDAIRHDLIQADGENLAYTINTQGIPQFTALHFGADALDTPCTVEWDTSSVTDRSKEAQTLNTLGPALSQLTDAFAQHGIAIDAHELAVRYNVPLHGLPAAIVADPEQPPVEETPADTEGVETVGESGASEPAAAGKPKPSAPRGEQ